MIALRSKAGEGLYGERVAGVELRKASVESVESVASKPRTRRGLLEPFLVCAALFFGGPSCATVACLSWL